jgi:hypothetical protein
MKYYVYSNETNRVVDIIEGDTNEVIEAIAGAKWDTNDYAGTYSPGLDIPAIGDFLGD